DLQATILAGARRFWPQAPRIEPARRDLKTPAQDRDGVVGLLHRDEPKSYRLCFAKKAAAFFRMSRSSARIRFSLRSRASSSRSAVVRPVRPFVRSAWACRTQLASEDGVRSKSRETAPIVLPSSNTSRT